MILDFFGDIDWAAVAVATVAGFALGSVWFAPPVFGNYWARHVSEYSRIPEAEITGDAGRPASLGKWLVAAGVNAVALALAVEAIGADSAGDGAALGIVLGVGMGATLASWPVIFTRMPKEWWLVNSGAFVAMQAAMGAVLGAW